MTVNERRLATMIRRRDRLAAELAEAEKRVRAGINDFSREKGFLVSLRIEQVRPMLGMGNSARRMMH